MSFTGMVRITYTNLTTGETYEPVSSGPGTVDLSTGFSVIRGGNGALFDNNGVLISTNGRIVLDENGQIVSLSGRTTDVCSKIGSSPL